MAQRSRYMVQQVMRTDDGDKYRFVDFDDKDEALKFVGSIKQALLAKNSGWVVTTEWKNRHLDMTNVNTCYSTTVVAYERVGISVKQID